MDENPDADMDAVYPNSYIINNLPADIESKEYHIYDITKKGSIANESSTRLARSVDYALKNNASNNSILSTKEKVNNNLKNPLKMDEKPDTDTDDVLEGSEEIGNNKELKYNFRKSS